MAQKRMFDKNLLCDPRFNNLSNSAKYLFFMLCLYADDEGVVADPIGVTKSHRCTKKDLMSLYVARYLIQCSSGVAIIKHWFAHNYKQKSHITKSTYREELSQFVIDERGFYTSKNKDFCHKNAVEGCRKTAEQGRQKMPYSIDKISIDKNRLDKNSINTNICATSEAEVAPVAKNEITTLTKYKFPCKPSKNNKKTEWVLSQEDLDWYQETYPNLDINTELRKAWRWLKDNNLKTYQGMSKYISGWLARANDRMPSKKTQELKDKAREIYIQKNQDNSKSEEIHRAFEGARELKAKWSTPKLEERIADDNR